MIFNNLTISHHLIQKVETLNEPRILFSVVNRI